MKQALRDWVHSFADVRPDERSRTALMFLYYLLVLFAYYILKPVARGLFLEKLDADKLPWLYILMALLGGAGASWVSRATTRSRLTDVIGMTQLFLILNILLIWGLLFWPYLARVMLYVFNVWVGSFAVVTVGQFWLLANSLFDSRQARRLFPLIGIAAVLGGFFGGTFASVTVAAIGAQHLLLVCGLLVGATWFVVRGLRRYEPAAKFPLETEAKYRLADTLKPIWESSHLRTISFLVGLMFVVDTLVDYQFSVMAKETYSGAQLTSFLARFQGIYLNLLSFVLQLFLSGPVLRHLGVGGALAFAPVSVAAGCAGFLAFPSMLTAGFTRAIEAATRYTFTRPGMELLYSPVPRELKNRTKTFLETAVDRVSRATAGGLLLLCTSVLAFSLREITMLTIVLAAAWAGLAVLVLRTYMQTLRRSIEKREVHFENLTVNVSDAATLGALLQSLDSPNQRQVAYALGLLEQIPQVSLTDRLPGLLRHPSSEVRAATLRLLAGRGDRAALGEVEELLPSADPSVRVQAVHYLCQADPNPNLRLEQMLNHSDWDVRLAAIEAAEEYSYSRPVRTISPEWLEELRTRHPAGDGNARVLLARALPLADSSQVPVAELLRGLLGDSDPAVAGAALESAGKIQSRELVPLLVSKLPHRRVRAQARDALARYGPRIVGTLGDYLGDSREPEEVRRQIPRLLGQFATPEAADALIAHLPNSKRGARFQILKALNRIRRDHPEIRISPEVIDGEILQEAKLYHQLLLCVQGDRANGGPGRELLMATLKERLDQTMARLFRLSALRYSPKEVYDAYQGTRSTQSQRRAGALEFLDNLLERSHKRILLPLLEESSPERLQALGKELFGLQALDTEQCLRELTRSDDRWLQIVALYRAGELRLRALEPEIRSAATDPDPWVAETARLALARIAPPAV